MDLGHGLEAEPPILPGVDGQPVLPQCLLVIPLLPERQTEIVVGERRALDRLRSGGAAGLRGGGFPAPLPILEALQREVGLSLRQHRVERDGAPGGLPSRVVLPEVAVDEREEVVRFRVIGVPGDRLAERRQRGFVEPPVVEHLAVVEARDGAVGVERAGACEPVASGVELAAGLLRQAQLEHRGDVPRMPAEQRLELGDLGLGRADGGLLHR
jgi:hypothetical protein